MAMQENPEDDATEHPPVGADLELKLLVLADTLLAIAGLAKIELRGAVSAAPKWLLLSLLRLPLWFLLWLSCSALLTYLAYAVSGSVGLGLAALVLLHVLACLALERVLRRLRGRLSFSDTRKAVRDCVESAAAGSSPQTEENVRDPY